MSFWDRFWLWLFLAAAAVLMVSAAAVPLRRILRRRQGNPGRYQLDTIWISTGLVLCSVWALRYAVGLYGIVGGAAEPNELNRFEEIFNSIVHALQTFSMDEEYTDYLIAGKEMMRDLTGSSVAAGIYGGISAALNMIGPILGGAVIFDILLSFLPRVRLWTARFFLSRRRFYFFSELNDRAVALGQSLCDEQQYEDRKAFRRPVIVFTDAYTESDKEESAELRGAARALGAICLKEDITQIIRKPYFGAKCEYILIDTNELNNVRTLAELSAPQFYRSLHGATVRIFYQDDAFTATERQIIDGIWDRFAEEKKTAVWSLPYASLAKYCALMRSDLPRRERDRRENALGLSDETKQAAKGICGGLEGHGDAKKQFYQYVLRELPETDFGRAFAPAEGLPAEPAQSAAQVLAAAGITDGEVISDVNKSILREFALPEMPAVLRVRSFQHIIYQMLRDIPLYRPLMAKDSAARGTLNVGIIGCGGLGTEMLLAASWFGQMLHTSLTVNVVTLEETDQLMQRLMRRAPELLHSATPNDPCLRIYPEETGIEEYGRRYLTLRTAKADMTVLDPSQVICRERVFGKSEDGTDSYADGDSVLPLIDCDYFLVSTGRDDRNIEIAETLQRAVHISRTRQKITAEDGIAPVTIAYVVFDSDLADTLNTGQQSGLAEMFAVGSRKAIFSRKNMILTDPRLQDSDKLFLFADESELPGQDTERDNPDHVHTEMRENMRKRHSDVYGWMSSTARGLHLKYRLWSLYRYTLMHENAKRTDGEYALMRETLRSRENMLGDGQEDVRRLYAEAILREPGAVPMPNPPAKSHIYAVKDAPAESAEAWLTWLEHRRWNAYIRSCGFVRGKKDLMMRLHPMLVEVKEPGSKHSAYDMLDVICLDRKYDYKHYDRPLRRD